MAAHQALPQHVIAGGSADGWIAGDIAQLGSPSAPGTFIYEYDPIPSQKCKISGDQSICSPVNLYHMLLWGI